MSRRCDIYDKNEKSLCHFHSSVKFWDCRFDRTRFNEVEFRGVEWHKSKFDRCMFTDSRVRETYFISCSWKWNRWEDVIFGDFVKFMANVFINNIFNIHSSEILWYHSCKMYNMEWKWTTRSTRMHFELCTGDNMKFTGRHETFRIMHSSFSNVRFERMIVDKIQHCNAYMRRWMTVDSHIKDVENICEKGYLDEYCRASWTKAQVFKNEHCSKDLYSWCRDRINRHLPACIPVTHFRHAPVCIEKGQWNCGVKPSTWHWWERFDFKGKDMNTKHGRMGDDEDFTHRDDKMYTLDCIDRYMRMMKKREHIWIRDFERMNSTLEPKEMFDKLKPFNIDEYDKYRMRCVGRMNERMGERMSERTTEEREKCMEDGRKYQERHMEEERRREEMGLMDEMIYNLDRNYYCINYDY